MGILLGLMDKYGIKDTLSKEVDLVCERSRKNIAVLSGGIAISPWSCAFNGYIVRVARGVKEGRFR